MPLEGTVELALRKGEAPLYLVHFSQDAGRCQPPSRLRATGVATKEQREAVKEAVKGTRFTTAFGKTLKRLLASGVGVHHAGMLPRYRPARGEARPTGPAAGHMRHGYARAWASTCPSIPWC